MIETENNIYLIDKKEGESNMFCYLKNLFISKCNLDSDCKNLDYYLSLSNMYANHKLNGCEYNENIMNIINQIIS